MTRFSYATGAVAALLAAGPICILSALVGAVMFDGPAMTGGPASPLVLIPVLLLSIPFGMVIALLPVLLAGYGMARLGHAKPATRQPWVWAATGAGIGMLMALAIGPDWRGMLLFACTGGLCALIVRYGTRWFDEVA